MKKLYHINEAQTFKWSEVKITLGRKRHLAAVIGNETFKTSFTKSPVYKWTKGIELLSKTVKSESQPA